MTFLSYIPIIGKLFDKTLDLADQAIEDKDKKNELIGNITEMKSMVDQVLHLAELQVTTIPWIDGLHKMGRQILNLLILAAVFVLMLLGHEITPTAAAILGGGNIAYQLVKGKGK